MHALTVTSLEGQCPQLQVLSGFRFSLLGRESPATNVVRKIVAAAQNYRCFWSVPTGRKFRTTPPNRQTAGYIVYQHILDDCRPSGKFRTCLARESHAVGVMFCRKNRFSDALTFYAPRQPFAYQFFTGCPTFISTFGWHVPEERRAWLTERTMPVVPLLP